MGQRTKAESGERAGGGADERTGAGADVGGSGADGHGWVQQSDGTWCLADSCYETTIETDPKTGKQVVRFAFKGGKTCSRAAMKALRNALIGGAQTRIDLPATEQES